MTLEQAIRELQTRSRPGRQVGRLPTVEEVEATQKSLNVQFHPDYRRFLLQASNVFVGALDPAQITDSEGRNYLGKVVQSARAYGVPSELFPFCEDNADFYCFTEQGEVRFWSHNGAAQEKWPSLAAWIKEVWIDESA
ncbi:MAG TPA: SMI1/KNR4 family protein [Burkholderiales bacterium]|nr:SMI1/KNR4 family protein [Burkholderiales bacterium]